MLDRARRRDTPLLGSEEEVIPKHEQRYIPAQKIYLETERPRSRAMIVVENDDIENPRLAEKPSRSLDREV